MDGISIGRDFQLLELNGLKFAHQPTRAGYVLAQPIRSTDHFPSLWEVMSYTNSVRAFRGHGIF